MKKSWRKGVSLYITIVVLSVLLATVLGLNTILTEQIKTIRRMGDSVVAFFAADTGIEQAVKKINSGIYEYQFVGNLSSENTYSVETICCQAGFNCFFDGTPGKICPISATAFSDGGICVPQDRQIRFCVHSTGNYREIKRAIEVKI